MDLIKSKNCIEFFETCSKNDLDFFFNAILEFISENIEYSTFKNISNKIFIKKTKNVWKNIKKNHSNRYDDHVLKIIDFFNSKDYFNIPVGYCHGDLTFSNMLIQKQDTNSSTPIKIFLLDFLDSFIDSPLNDMVKVRQDTQFLWTTLMYKSNFDYNKISIINEYLDNKFHKFFSNYDFYNETYKYVQSLNILRILQYTSDKNKSSYLESCLNKI
jgi:thiamine kinase-like enzyme